MAKACGFKTEKLGEGS